MSSQIIETNATVYRSPADMPHGLLKPPDQVRELLKLEKTRRGAHVFSQETEERLLNQWTVGFYFEPLMQEVLYRTTPDGPEVVAVGFDEILALTRAISAEERRKLDTWMP